MTLIIALKCRNGIVVASDGQATALSSGGPVRQKIQKIENLPAGFKCHFWCFRFCRHDAKMQGSNKRLL